MMFYSPPRHIRDTSVPEIFASACSINRKCPMVHVLDGENSNLESPIFEVTWGQHFSAAASIAKILAKDIPIRRPGEPMRVVGILARSSYHFAVHWLASQLNGWTTLLISPKNSPEGIRHLLTISEATHVLTDDEFIHFTQSISTGLPVTTFTSLPPSNSNDEITLPDFYRDVEKAKDLDMPSIYLHTSGSSGHPKIIPCTHRTFSHYVQSYIEACAGLSDRSCYCLGPLFHALAFCMTLMVPLACGMTSFLVHSKYPITADATLRHLSEYRKYLFVNSGHEGRTVVLFAIPSILTDIVTSGEDAITTLGEATKAVFFGGAPLSIEAGEKLAQSGINLLPAYGMTETGVLTHFFVPPVPQINGDWEYVQWRKGYRMTMLETLEENVKELVVQAGADSPNVINSDDPVGFRTNDLWMEHPSKPGFWKHVGRAEGVTVLSNGEKTNDKQLQILLTQDRNIAHAIVFGAGKIQNGVILSPAKPSMASGEFLDEIWPTIEHLNTVIPKHSHLIRKLILVEDPRRPFLLTDKGTVREKITLDLYQNDIERAYRKLEVDGGDDLVLPESLDVVSITDFLTHAASSMLGRQVTPDADLFEQGLDSLLAVSFQGLVVKLMGHSSISLEIPRNLVYSHPSINNLVQYLVSQIQSSSVFGSVFKEKGNHELAEDCVRRFTTNLKPRVIQNGISGDGTECVAITGTTGSLGSFLLYELWKRPSVRIVYCLNRSSSSPTVERQLKALEDRGIDASDMKKEIGGRVKFLDVDLGDAKLGLNNSEYDDIRSNVTHIIHSAWLLNFNLTLHSFEKTHVAGVRHLIDLTLASPRAECPRFVFLSSIGGVLEYKDADIVPEEHLDDANITSTGYGLGKFAGEKICMAAVEKAGLNATVVRIGQIAGALKTGAWAASEYMPMLFRSCFAMGTVPADLPPVRWLPADITARVILGQTFPPALLSQPFMFFNLENPHSTPWSSIANFLSRYKEAGLELVKKEDWLIQLRGYSVEDADRVPAVRLGAEFYNNLEIFLPLAVEKTRQVAPEVNYGEIDEELLSRYLAYQGL